MRRLVGISSKAKKSIMALMALAIALTSIHVAAAARTATLKREQEQLEKTFVSSKQSAFSAQQTVFDGQSSAISQISNLASIGKNEENAPLITKPSAPGGSSASPARQRQIIISIADRKLALLEDGKMLKTYPIAVGARHTPSPDGDFVIVNHAKDPTYRHGNKEIAPGNSNPLGSRWMGLSLKGYGIHGTNVQSSVGKAVSHGCFRMRKQDVEELYTMVQVGDTVTIRRERDAMIAQVFAPIAPVAAKTLAVAQNNAGEMQIAASEKATVETAEQ
jgi:lipoprotein-anchoring transpeptidase ErfK/SrfK